MEIQKLENGSEVTLIVSGSIDASTAPKLEAESIGYLESATLLVFDFKGVDYISSAGLRVLLRSQKEMAKHGKMIIRHVDPLVMEVFEMTSFTDYLTIEP